MPSVLVVEDNIDLRMLYQKALESESHQVHLAANGEEALVVLRAMQPKPDLILLDLMMPVMDGHKFLTVQSADPAIADIPVVVCSAARANIPAKYGFLRKPIDLEALLKAVVQYANR